MPPSDRPPLGRGPTGKDKPQMVQKPYLSHDTLVLDHSRQMTPATEPSSTTTSSPSPNASQAWRTSPNFGPPLIHSVENLPWPEHQGVNVISNEDNFDTSRSPSVVSQSKPFYSFPLPTHHSPSRHNPNDTPFMPQYHSDRSHSGTELSTPNSSPAFTLRQVTDGEPSSYPSYHHQQHQYPPQGNIPSQPVHHPGHHHSLSCDLPISNHHHHPLSHSLTNGRDTSSIGHKRSITSPDVSVLSLPSFSQSSALHSHLRDSNVRSPQSVPPHHSLPGLNAINDSGTRLLSGPFGV
jgi:hypothetical protein